MESILSSLSLPEDLDQKLKKVAQNRGQTKNGLVLEALRRYLDHLEIYEVEKKLQAKARLLGIENDDDVTALVKKFRSSGSADRSK